MPFKTLDDIVEPAAYQKNLLAGLKASVGKVAKLHYFEGFPFSNQTAALVLVGPVENKLLQKITEKGAKLRAKGSVTEGDDAIRYKAAGVKADVLTKALKIGKIKKEAVAVEELADAGDDEPAAEVIAETPVAEAETETEKAPVKSAPTQEQLLDAATKRFDLLSARAKKLVENASAAHKERMTATEADCKQLVAQSKLKEAAKALAVFEQVLDDVERLHEQKLAAVAALRKQIAGLQEHLEGFTPPLRGEPATEIKKKLTLAVKASSGNDPDWATARRECSEVQAALAGWDKLEAKYETAHADYLQLKADVTQKSGLYKVRLQLLNKKADLLERLSAAAKVKPPSSLTDDKAYDLLHKAYRDILNWLETEIRPPDKEVDADPVMRRMKAFKHDDPKTWEIKLPVEYKNGTSAADIGGKEADLKLFALTSNTTAGGSVLKVNYEGHAHLDGGSGGVAFVYRRNDDYTVTPVVVDVSSKRGGKNGNQYTWDTGGGWSYFPPNAKY